MRIATFILLVATMSVAAKGFSQSVTISARHLSLIKVFKAIEQQAGYGVFYDAHILKNAPPLNMDLKNATVEKVLQEALKDQSFDYTIENRTITISRKPVLLPVADTSRGTVSGKVTDTVNTPLPGATITVKGTRQGAVTNNEGQFSIPAVDKNAVLLINFVGYKPQEITLNGRTHVNITLAVNTQSLNDVVVVGYGTQKKENLTGAIATVSAKELEGRPLVNLGQGLQGLVPNLNVNLNSGKPGTGASFNVRGITSIGGDGNNTLGGPLVMVDGVQMDPNLINPGDVESVTVLKDAASAAIYGSRGAYGVILITTKTGKKNSGLHLNYSGSYTVTKPTKLPKYLNSVDYIAMHREADRNGQLSGGNTATMPFTEQDVSMAAKYFADPAHNPSGYPDPANLARYRYVGNTDWIKVLYPGWAPQQQHNVSVSGGSEKTSFIGSLGYFDQKGMVKQGHEDYQRINPSLRVTTEATSWLSLNLKTNLNHIVSNEPNGTEVVNDSYIQGDSRPNMPVFNPNGTDYSGQGNWTNPMAVMAQNGRDKYTANDIWLTGGAVISPVEHVKINADYTFNNYSGFRQKVQRQFPEYGVDHVFIDYYPWTYPDATTEVSNNNNYNALNIFANYENTFHAAHYFKATIGYNQERRHFKTVNTTAKNLIDPGTPNIGLNDDLKPDVTSSEFDWGLNGLLYRLNYIYKSKYLLEVDGRYDGTSAFPGNRRFVWSPSVSAGWRISEEHFFKPLKTAVNDLKLRASYGQLPNQLFDPNNPTDASIYPYIALMPNGKTNYIFGSQQSIYAGAPGLVSIDFTWEKVISRDIGFDISLLDQRLSGTFDWYIRDTKDMLVGGQPLPSVLGVAPPLKNAANLRTKGWELSMNWNDKIGDDFTYGVRIGLSDYSATITKYDLNPTGIFTDGNHYVGQKFGEIWGYVTDGYFKTDAEGAAADQSQLSGVTQMAGDIRYKDLNKDGKISHGDNTISNPGDQKIIGNSTPRYQYGVNLSVQYKGFDLAIFVQGVAKRDYMPNDNAFWGFKSEWRVPFTYLKDHWTPENTNAYFPRLRFRGGSNFQTQTKYLQSAAYCRLKNLALGYRLPATLLNPIKIKSARVYVSGQNLFEVTKLFKAYDPEIIGFSTYPLSRAVSFGVQIGL